MNFIADYIRAKQEIQLLRPRISEVASEMSQSLGHKVELVPARSKGGFDKIFHAKQGGRAFAVVRMNDPNKHAEEQPNQQGPRVALSAEARLNREWEAYTTLSPIGLSPKPLWRNPYAIACTLSPFKRVSRVLVRQRNLCPPISQSVFKTVAKMHATGVYHLDLNLGNLLIDAQQQEVMVIDFEYDALPWLATEQAMAFDYLKLIEDLLRPRRGGKYFLANLPTLTQTLDACIPSAVRQAELGFCRAYLTRIYREKSILSILNQLFPNLERQSSSPHHGQTVASDHASC